MRRPCGVLPASTIHVNVVAAGDMYSVCLNGSATAATTHTTNVYAEGEVGLYDFSGDAHGSSFDNFSLTGQTVDVVPEPATLTLLAMGLFGADARRLRRRRPARS